MSKSANVKVYCRIRPENEKEKSTGLPICMEPTSDTSLRISVENLSINSGLKENYSDKTYQDFTYDKVFPSTTTQNTIFEKVAKPLISAAFEGINGTLFCYGQTSSGKTYTMEGIINDNVLMGIIPRMMSLIFDIISQGSSDIEYSVKCQYYQIYNEKIIDLLDPRKTDLAIREDKNKGIWVEDCTEQYVESEQEMLDFFKDGAQNRAVASTKMNNVSSRSHSLFAVIIYQRNTITESSKVGKLYFVDLAGSEKMSKAGIESGTILKEAQNINKSIMTLGMVINALTKGAKHVPYRDSKLTRVLQESLGGNSLTNLIINCSPSMINQSESLSTLRFGQRAKLIKNVVVANTQQSVKELMMLLKQAEDKIKSLEEIIGAGDNLSDEKKKKYLALDKKCPECKKFLNQVNYLTMQNSNIIQENEYLQKDKNDLQDEIKNKNQELLVIKENLQKLEAQIKNYSDEQLKAYIEIQKNMENYTNIYKKIQSCISSKNFNEVSKLNDNAYKKWIELMGKLSVEIKINNLKNLNNHEILNKTFTTEKMDMLEEEFLEKEKQYLKTINELKEKVNNNQSNQMIKNNLKLIDRPTLDELINQIKDYLLKNKNTKNSKDLNKKISNTIVGIINNNFNTNKLEKEKLCSRLQKMNIENFSITKLTVNKSKIYNNYNHNNNDENNILDNISNEALQKSFNDKNARILRLESDVKEYKEKLSLFESQLTPDEKNLHKKIYTLEKNLEQVNSMYHQIVTQKSVLKIENQIFEKKLKKRNEKINTLMKENYNLLEQLKVKDEKIQGFQKSKNNDGPAPRLIKVIRGSNNKKIGSGENNGINSTVKNHKSVSKFNVMFDD